MIDHRQGIREERLRAAASGTMDLPTVPNSQILYHGDVDRWKLWCRVLETYERIHLQTTSRIIDQVQQSRQCREWSEGQSVSLTKIDLSSPCADNKVEK